MKKTAFLFLLLLLSTACSQGPDRAVVFAVGGAPAELDFWENLADEFTRTSGIPVRILRQPSDTDQQRQSLVIALKARMKDPDVFLMDIAWIGLFSAADWLMPLEADMDTTPFFGQVIDTVDRFNGRLIALPVYMDAGVLYYRKDLVKAPPDTWQTLIASARKVQEAQRKTQPDFYGFVWTGAQYEGLITVFMEFAGTSGGFVEENEGIRLNCPANIRALRMMRELIQPLAVSPANTFTQMKEEEVRMAFQQGHILYERNWPYAWALHEADDSPVRGKTGVAQVPAPETGRSVSTLGGFHVGVSRYTNVKAEAMAFVQFITSYDNQKRMVMELGWNPGRQDLYDDPSILAKAPHFNALKSVFQHARPRPLKPYYSQISAVAQTHINRVLAGHAAPEEALAKADLEIQGILSRYQVDP